VRRDRGRRSKYRHSTPVTRLRRNVLKVLYHDGLALSRLRGWQTGSDDDVGRLLDLAEQVAELGAEMDVQLAKLEESGFVPPRRSQARVFELGQHVRVEEAARPRYRLLYERQLRDDPEMLDDLVVDKVLPSGEVAVRRGRRAPIAARKSHLVPIKGS
jgi:hypothetical protein